MGGENSKSRTSEMYCLKCDESSVTSAFIIDEKIRREISSFIFTGSADGTIRIWGPNQSRVNFGPNRRVRTKVAYHSLRTPFTVLKEFKTGDPVRTLLQCKRYHGNKVEFYFVAACSKSIRVYSINEKEPLSEKRQECRLSEPNEICGFHQLKVKDPVFIARLRSGELHSYDLDRNEITHQYTTVIPVETPFLTSNQQKYSNLHKKCIYFLSSTKESSFVVLFDVVNDRIVHEFRESKCNKIQCFTVSKHGYSRESLICCGHSICIYHSSKKDVHSKNKNLLVHEFKYSNQYVIQDILLVGSHIITGDSASNFCNFSLRDYSNDDIRINKIDEMKNCHLEQEEEQEETKIIGNEDGITNLILYGVPLAPRDPNEKPRARHPGSLGSSNRNIRIIITFQNSGDLKVLNSGPWHFSRNEWML